MKMLRNEEQKGPQKRYEDLGEIGIYTEEMNIFKEELLVTEKNANNILVYNISIHLAFIIDRFFFQGTSILKMDSLYVFFTQVILTHSTKVLP